MKTLDGGLKLLVIGVVLAVAAGCATAPQEEAPPEPAAPEAAPEAMPAPEPGVMPEPTAEPEAPMPAPAQMAEPEPVVVVEEGLTRYTVVRGDNLWDIASYRVIYGNPYQWPLIFRANKDQIEDADLIFPDQVLVIPRDSSASEIEAAIQHARTRGAWTLGVVEESDVAYLSR